MRTLLDAAVVMAADAHEFDFRARTATAAAPVPAPVGRSGCRFEGSASGSVSRVSRPVSGSGPPVFVLLAVVWVRVCRG